MSSDYSAGILIKKWRFPLYQPPSPPEQEIPLTAQNDLEQKGHSSPSLGSAVDVIGFMENSNASGLSACSSSVVCGAAMSSVINSAASLDDSGLVSSSTITGTPAAASDIFPGPILNAGFFGGNLNPSIAETGSNANVIAAGSTAGTGVEEGSNSCSLVGSDAKRVATISNFGGSEGNKSVFSEHRDKNIGVKKCHFAF